MIAKLNTSLSRCDAGEAALLVTVRIKKAWNDLRGSLWFVPGLLTLAAIALALIAIEIDDRVDREWLAQFPRLFGADAEGARAMVGSIATSVITVAALVFSITVSALSQASTQFTPRILRNFMANRSNQVVLGAFAAIYVYCLVVLRTVREDTTGEGFVPGISILIAFMLAILGVGLLIYFIHHVAMSLQASTIVSTAADETIRTVRRLYPEKNPAERQAAPHSAARARLAESRPQLIRASELGYLQYIDSDKLARIACDVDCRIACQIAAGDFANTRTALAGIHADRDLDEDEVARIRSCFILASHRTIEQDVRFGIGQISDIAIKSLSASNTNSTIARLCIDYLTAILIIVATRAEAPETVSRNEQVRVTLISPRFEELLRLAFDEVAETAADHLGVSAALLAGLSQIEAAARNPRRGEIVSEMRGAYYARIKRKLDDGDRIEIESLVARSRLEQLDSAEPGVRSSATPSNSASQ